MEMMVYLTLNESSCWVFPDSRPMNFDYGPPVILDFFLKLVPPRTFRTVHLPFFSDHSLPYCVSVGPASMDVSLLPCV